MFIQYFIHSGVGHGSTSLTSFDQALLKAGMGNYNLVRVSSILPVGLIETNRISLPEGAPLHIAYASITSNNPGDCISSAVSVGIPIDKSKIGVIMEHSAPISEATCRQMAELMVIEAMNCRGYEIERIITTSCSAIVHGSGYTSVFSGLAMW